MPSDHDQVVRDSFRRQVDAFSGSDSVYAGRDRALAWIAPLDPSMRVLDVACGAAHAAESVAPAVQAVVGIDLTPELLDVGRARLRHTGAHNVALLEGNAQRLPFTEQELDAAFPPGTTISHTETSDSRLPIDVAMTDQSDREGVVAALRAELAGGPETGFAPTDDKDSIVVSFLIRTVHGIKR